MHDHGQRPDRARRHDEPDDDAQERCGPCEIARQNRLPVVNLVESGGADLPTQSEIFIPGGQTFHDITDCRRRASRPIAVVFGNSTAGGAYVRG